MFGTVGNQLFEGVLTDRCVNEAGEINMLEDGFEDICLSDK
jgi:hypothetical protein